METQKGRRRGGDLRVVFAARGFRPRPSAFSLVEMLVVVAILGILASLIMPAVWRAVVRAREARIILEVSQLDMAMESYKQRLGAYPPSGFLPDPRSGNDEREAAEDMRDRLFRRHLRLAFPRHNEAGTLTRLSRRGLSPAEALVFWLSQVINDPRQPLSRDGDPNVFFPFEESRLVPSEQDEDGQPIRYRLGDRVINFYEYFPPGVTEMPYAYFAHPYAIVDKDNTKINSFRRRPNSSEILLHPYQSRNRMPDGQVNPASPPGNQWMNPTTFQIIAPGLSGEYGEVNSEQFKVYMDPGTYAEGDWDNIANFSDGRTFVDSLE